ELRICLARECIKYYPLDTQHALKIIFAKRKPSNEPEPIIAVHEHADIVVFINVGDVRTLTMERERVESFVAIVNAPRRSFQCSLCVFII
ncbi:unnamed protein product, partial [Adineta steineri]